MKEQKQDFFSYQEKLNRKLRKLLFSKYSLFQNTLTVREKVFEVFIVASIILIVVLKLKNYESQSDFLFIVVGFVSLIRYAHSYIWIISWLWEKPLGKVLLTLTTPVIAALAKLMSDQQIRYLVQTSPSHFPTAQQSLFVYNGLEVVILILSALFLIRCLLITTGWSLSIFLNQSSFNFRNFVEATSSMCSGALLMYGILQLDSLFGFKDKYGNQMILSEEIILASSFVKNEGVFLFRNEESGKVLEKIVKFCTNLDGDYYVSPAGNELVPVQVVTAKLAKSLSGHGRYEYRLQMCQNSNRLLKEYSLQSVKIRLGSTSF